MNRRDLLKTLLIFPFFGIFRSKKVIRFNRFNSGELSPLLKERSVCDNDSVYGSFIDGNRKEIKLYRADSRPQYEIGTRFIRWDGWTFRYMKSPANHRIYGQELRRPIWFWIEDS